MRAHLFAPLFALNVTCATATPAGWEFDPAWTIVEGGITRGSTASREIALVFTGGDHGEGASTILDTLREHGIRAAFFVTGAFVSREEHHPLLRRMVDEGHYVGPHSHAHPLYASWDDRSQTLVSEEFFRQDLQRNIDELRAFGAMAGPGPIYFIPPSEWYNREQVDWAREIGVVLINFTPGSGSNRDWAPESHASFMSSEAILQGILDFEQREERGLNGFLLLLHLGSQRRDKMHPLFPRLVTALQERGYRFVRVDELLPLAPRD